MQDIIHQVWTSLRALAAGLAELSHDGLAAYQRLAPKWKAAVCAAAVILAAGFAWYALSPASVDLRLSLHHPFRSADLTVTIDGSTAYSGQISAQSRKKLLLFDRVDGLFSRSFSVAPGTHTVRLHIRSTALAYDQQAQRTLDVAAGRGGTLEVMAKNGADLRLDWQPVPPAGEGGRVPALLNTINSILLTLLGAVLSAIVGHYVQEFLKSRRQPVAAVSTPKPSL